jgi:hypothetical protein
LRLVVKMTGHDLLGRSTGYGSLEIWLRYLRQGVNFEKTYMPTPSYNQSTKPLWTGSAIEVNGGYSWGDVYKVAVENRVIVVGGGCPVCLATSTSLLLYFVWIFRVINIVVDEPPRMLVP